MSERRTLSGSITVFASLSLMLVASFLLALLESARVKGLEAYSGMHRENAVESVLSEYDRDLFDRFGIFLLDGGYGSGTLQFAQIDGRLLEISQKNLRPDVRGLSLHTAQNFYQMDVAQAQMERYLLATDADGAPFRAMAAASMKARYPAEALQTLSEQFRRSETAMDQAKQSQSSMNEAQQQIAQAKKQAAEAAQSGDTADQPDAAPVEPPENPMDVVKELKKTDLLTLVMPEGVRVSEKQIDGSTTLEHRQLIQGNEPWSGSADWSEPVLYQQFLQTQFRCFTSETAGSGALDYELEYIAAGKDSDHANLKSVVRRVLLLREGANFLYLQADAAKQAEAYELAAAIAAAFAIAPATPLLAQGILATWAYAESILDVRALLSGGRVPWIKTAESWSSDLSGIGTLLAGNAQAKTTESGDDYTGYLQKLLYFTSARASNYRAMDLMEWYRAGYGEGQIRMDAMIVTFRAAFCYEAQPLFSGLVTLQRLSVDRLEFAASATGSYFKKNQ